MKAYPLFWQLFPSFMILVIVCLAFIYLLASTTISTFFYSKAVKDLQNQVDIMRPQIQESLEPQKYEQLNKFLKKIGKETETKFSVYSEKGLWIADSDAQVKDGNFLNFPELAQALSGEEANSLKYSRFGRYNSIYVSKPIIIEGKVVAVLRAQISQYQVRVWLERIYKQILAGGVGLLLLMVCVSYLMSRRLSKPLELIENQADKMSRGDFSGRVHLKETAPEEVQSLAKKMNDITIELKKRLETVINQKNERDAILTSMQEGVLAVDLDYKITHLNVAAANIFAVEKQDSVGSSIQEIIRVPELHKFIAESFEKEIPQSIEVDIIINQKKKSIELYSSPLGSAKNKNLGVVVVVIDNTKLKLLESHRRDFVANVSHELRTPLTSITGYVETLLNPQVNEEERMKFLNVIHKHTLRLTEIVEDLLTLSKLDKSDEHGEIELREQLVFPILESAAEVCQIKTTRLGVKVHINGDPELKANVNSALFEQAIVNLIDNGAKYSSGENKEVKISLFENPKDLEVRVEDFGRGIASEHLPRLFERFYRVDKARSRDQGGTGLGLSIVKNVILAHKATIDVASELGKGSTFSIKLPKS